MTQFDSTKLKEHFDIALVTIGLGALFRELAEGLAQRGLNVLVVVPNRDYKNPDRCSSSEKISDNLFIERISVPRMDKNRMIQKLLLFCCVAYKANKILRDKKIDLFLAPMMPIIIPYKTFLFSKRKDKPFVLLLEDMVPDTWIRRKRFFRYNPFVMLIRKQTKQLLHGSKKVTVIGRDMKDFIQDTYGVPEEKIEFIPNWGKLCQDASRYEPPADERFVIMYGGTISEAQNLESLLFAAEIVATKDPSIEFQIIGSGMKKDELQKIVLDRKIKNVQFLDMQPEEEYKKTMARASLLVVSLRNESKGMSVPSKTYTCLAAGKPILAIVPIGSEIFLEIQEDGYGIFCPPDDPQKIAEAILRVKNDRDLLAQITKNAVEANRLKYNDQVAVNSYYKLISNLLDKG